MIYSPEIPGPRPGDTRDEWEIPVMVARKFDPERAVAALPLARHAGHSQRNRPRLPHLQGNRRSCRQKGDQFQYGGPRLLVDRCLTP